MAAKRILIACALAMVFGSVGCQHWCERHYPCPAQAPAYAPACQPCYQQPVSYAPQPNWSAPAAPVGGRSMNCTCVPN